MSFTPAQQQAIGARGNVLVVAGAGTGKTRTLVERCLHCLMHETPPASIEEILMVTFTEAAAAEMRQRIRLRLEEHARNAPGDSRWSEQLALFERAQIGTLHSFCLRLIREHFYELELDPQFSVMSEEDARLLAEETLDDLFNEYYGAPDGLGKRLQTVIQEQGSGSDQLIRTVILQLHRYAQALPEGAKWLVDQAALFSTESPPRWAEWLHSAVLEWKDTWLPLLKLAAPENKVAAGCANVLRTLKAGFERTEASQILTNILEQFASCPPRKKTSWIKPFSVFCADTEFLSSLLVWGKGTDPLLEDWQWVRERNRTVLESAAEFARRFADAKRELGVADFQDLEQHALALLWDSGHDQPSAVAQQWRERIRFVFVDEYQDINAVQDRIITALSREGPEANRFLVGDVKQSIYRFRLANPTIFQRYASAWRNADGQAIPLRENFRSHVGILRFVNSLLGDLIRPEIGGVAYDEQASLLPGNPAAQNHTPPEPAATLPVEIHFRVKETGEETNGSEENGAVGDFQELAEAEKEARMIAARLRELHERKYPVWDEAAGAFRPVDWKDVAILLRSPSSKSESYAKEFTRARIPLLVERGGFYDSLEVSDLLSVMQVLDNPLQDVPVLAVLRSPIAGVTAAELAEIRMASPRGRYWTALVQWHRQNRAAGKEKLERQAQELYAKVDAFLARYAQWRRLARQASLCRCFEVILAETHYASWVLTQPRGQQRHANVRRLLGLAQHFDQFQKQGLFRFLRFIEAQRAIQSEPAVPAVADQNAVRLMSIHQSKGLEFPVVVVADLAKPFNFSDLNAEIILDEEFGLCSQVRPPQTGSTYPSLPYWLARRRQKRELIGEEMRLLYVALTRARDLLVLAASLSPRKHDQLFETPAEAGSMDLLRAQSCADWIVPWFARNQPGPPADQGQHQFLRWFVCRDSVLAGQGTSGAAEEKAQDPSLLDEAAWRIVQNKLSAPYRYETATRQPAKMSVTTLRRLAVSEDEEAAQLPAARSARFIRKTNVREGRTSGRRRLTATEIGNAHHLFMQRVSLERTDTVGSLEAEAKRLLAESALETDQVAALDFGALGRFWASTVGKRIRANANSVRREMPFTCRLNADDVSRLTGKPRDPALEQEWVVVQGVADLVVTLPGELWVLDFKTDDIAATEVKARAEYYRVQLRIYALALSRILARPVTRCWLYFLVPGQEVEVPLSEPSAVPAQMLMPF